MSLRNLNADGLGPALESGEIEMVAGDGREGAFIFYFIFDIIHGVGGF